ncbi:hypothetical protein GF359_00275 [candidate division WOR-3 bacterium]|uniref:Uncharacterized protein n=1 Tax=candidate division WOR-3 bacterium TaxID=2052148 RepID=A0A9D5QBI0_UNCW3|nr:hypothetical protein [candidate division WOR-3 bacterium]MBD3363628.1 hypothetical protein [candidate division WOR-3 bacterium]
MRKSIKVILLVLCASVLFFVVLFPPFYVYPKTEGLEENRARIAHSTSYYHTTRYYTEEVMRRDWRFIALESGRGGCRPVDWGMIALELTGVLGLWLTSWVIYKLIEKKKHNNV